MAAAVDGAGLLSRFEPLEVFAWSSGTAMWLLAAALLVAAQHTDRLALRLFALRYFLAGLGWFVVHPQAARDTAPLPLSSMLVAVSMLWLTAVALDVYLRRTTWLRLAIQVCVALGTGLMLWAFNRMRPFDPLAIYLVMALGMGWMAWLAWQAAATERNAGHRIIACAMLSYPVVVALALSGVSTRLSDLELGYVVAVPSFAMGLAVLLASLIRFGRRLEVELLERQRAERQVRELNAGLEHRVAERTAELRLIVQGLEAFTRNVSHDLRGPLAGVAGVARLAEDALARGDTARAQRMLAPLALQADHLSALVQDLLTLSRVSEAPCELVKQPLAPVLDAALAQLALAPETAPLLTQVRLLREPLPEAAIDASLMQQVFVNLIGNALRFANAGQGSPEVRVGVEHAAGATTIFVADNGPGFAPEQASLLFKPFARLHGANLSRNGIGLSIVQRIVEHHGGRVWAECKGAGAVFRLALAT